MKADIKRIFNNIFWGVYGRQVHNPPIKEFPTRLLFVCKGNICRSPFAEELARKILRDKDLNRISVESAGFIAVPSNTPPREAIISSSYFGVNLANRTPIKVDDHMMNKADMILVMEVAHRKILKNIFKWERNNIFLLPLYLSKQEISSDNIYRKFNIADPYGGNEELFLNCYNQIEKCLYGLIYSIEAVKHW